MAHRVPASSSALQSQVAVAGVSGSRTKKHAKKVARAERLSGKEAAALEEGAMQVGWAA